jgi:uncharacterized Tic20 family protein
MAGDNYQDPTTQSTESPIHSGITPDDKTWAMLCHISGLAGYLGVIPFASVIGPLIVWLLKKDTSAFVDEHGKESLNFQITMSIFYVIAIMLCFVLIGFLILPFLGIWMIVLVIIGAIKASNGEHFRYPLTIRLVN